MSLFTSKSRHRKHATIGIVAVLGVTGVATAAIAFGGGDSHAAEPCGPLDTALQNNLNFIAGQRANPDAQSEARIANRQAVVDLIQQRRQAAGCTGDVQAGDQQQDEQQDQQQDQNQNQNRAPGVRLPVAPSAPAGSLPGGAIDTPPASSATAPPSGANGSGRNNGGGAAAGEPVCQGSTLTKTGEGGAPAASSGQFPIGTRVKVTNLDNNKSTTVEVASPSGSCLLLNNAAFEQVREPGKEVIRQVRIERVG